MAKHEWPKVCSKCGGKDLSVVVEGEWCWFVCGGHKAFYDDRHESNDEPRDGYCGCLLETGTVVYGPEAVPSVGYVWDCDKEQNDPDPMPYHRCQQVG